MRAKRRQIVLGSLFLAACSGSGSNSAVSPAPVPAPPLVAWNVSGNLTQGIPADLSASLPAGVKRGGVFSVSSIGPSLPAWIQLTPAGILTASQVGTVSGIIFQYVEP